MKLLRIPKLPKIKLPMPRRPAGPKKLQARMRAADAPLPDAYDEEPQTKLTSAFIVVLILHVVAVGGIYAFNQIKASRRSGEAGASIAAPAAGETGGKSNPATAKAGNTQVAAAPAAPAASLAPTLKQRVYNVKPGDNLLAIARTFGVSASDLKAANGLSSDVIHPGQVLNLPGAKATGETPSVAAPKPAEAESKLTTKTYIVKSGDRLVFIAKKFGVTQEDLVALNKMKDPGKLQIGQTLKIPVRKGN